MPTHIDKLTSQQQAAIPAFRDRWIAVGLRTGETDWATFDQAMPICYAKTGIPYPPRVIRVTSPLVGALASMIAEGIWRMRRKKRDAVDGAVADAVVGAVDGAVADAVVGAVGGAVDGAVRDAVDGAVGDAVDGAVRDAVRDAVDGAVRDAVRDAVHAAFHDTVGAVDGANARTIITSLCQAYQISPNKKLSWHDWLGGQFWVGGWYWGVAFVQFFLEVCHLQLSTDLMDRATAYRQLCESVNYIWPNREFVMVCARPTAIHLDAQGRLHSEHGMAIRYPDGWGLYLLHGVRFEADFYHRIVTRSLTAKEILQFEDIDQRVQAMKFAKDGVRDFYRAEGGQRIDTYAKHDAQGRTIRYELWRVPKGRTFTKAVSFMVYDCPSALARGEQREYSKGVPNVATVAEAMAWGMSGEDVSVTPEQWELLEPLVTES